MLVGIGDCVYFTGILVLASLWDGLIPTIISGAVTLLLALLGVAVAFGRLNKGQDDISQNMHDMAAQLKKLPDMYVSSDLDKQRQKWLDERDDRMTEQLTDIKNEIRRLGERRP